MKKFLFVGMIALLGLLGALGLMANSPAAHASAPPAAPRTCTYVTLVYTNTVLSKSWDGQTSGCYVITASQAGDFKVTSGWVFDSVTLNGSVVTTTVVTGELARQIVPLTTTVTAGQVLVFDVIAAAPHSAELGLRIDYSATVYKIFMPVIKK